MYGTHKEKRMILITKMSSTYSEANHFDFFPYSTKSRAHTRLHSLSTDFNYFWWDFFFPTRFHAEKFFLCVCLCCGGRRVKSNFLVLPHESGFLWLRRVPKGKWEKKYYVDDDNANYGNAGGVKCKYES